MIFVEQWMLRLLSLFSEQTKGIVSIRVREKCGRWFPAEIFNQRGDGLEPRVELLPKSAG